MFRRVFTHSQLNMQDGQCTKSIDNTAHQQQQLVYCSLLNGLGLDAFVFVTAASGLNSLTGRGLFAGNSWVLRSPSTYGAGSSYTAGGAESSSDGPSYWWCCLLGSRGGT